MAGPCAPMAIGVLTLDIRRFFTPMIPHWFILVLLAVSNSLIGTIIAKKWINNHEALLFWISLIFFLFSSLAWIEVLKYERLTIVSSVWDISYLILVIILGILVYQERLNWQEGIGVILAIITIILLTVKF